jgi:hypothetical protein
MKPTETERNSKNIFIYLFIFGLFMKLSVAHTVD